VVEHEAQEHFKAKKSKIKQERLNNKVKIGKDEKIIVERFIKSCFKVLSNDILTLYFLQAAYLEFNF